MCLGRMPISPSVVRVNTAVACPDHSRRSTATSSTVISATRVSIRPDLWPKFRRCVHNLDDPTGVHGVETRQRGGKVTIGGGTGRVRGLRRAPAGGRCARGRPGTRVSALAPDRRTAREPYPRAALANAATNRWRARSRRVGRNHAAGLAPCWCRAAFDALSFDDPAEAQTAAVLGCSVCTVKSQTSRGLVACGSLTIVSGHLRPVETGTHGQPAQRRRPAARSHPGRPRARRGVPAAWQRDLVPPRLRRSVRLASAQPDRCWSAARQRRQLLADRGSDDR